MKYTGIIGYTETELRTFAQKPLSAVDSLVFSQFSYNELSCVFPQSGSPEALSVKEIFLAEHFSSMFAPIYEEDKSRLLLSAMAASPRYRDVTVSHYVSEHDTVEEKQFSAMCLRLLPDLVYIAFCGTDDTLVGWKEDFSIAFKTPVPSQRRAAEYLSSVALEESGSLILGGHSKGGNLALYAAMTAKEDLQSRIIRIYDHDGPGFKAGVLDNDGYRRIKHRIQKTIPQSSLIGMLLDGHDQYSVVASRRMGIMQHDPFSWEVHQGNFRAVEEVTDSAKYINSAVRLWLDGLTDHDRERFVEALFSILDAGRAETFSEITRQWRKNSAAIFTAMKDADPEMKEHIHALLKDFVTILGQNLRAKVLPKRRGETIDFTFGV